MSRPRHRRHQQQHPEGPPPTARRSWRGGDARTPRPPNGRRRLRRRRSSEKTRRDAGRLADDSISTPSPAPALLADDASRRTRADDAGRRRRQTDAIPRAPAPPAGRCCWGCRRLNQRSATKCSADGVLPSGGNKTDRQRGRQRESYW